MVDPACFPSSTKTSGTHNVLRLTPQKSVFGVRFKLNMKMNSGAFAQRTVSTNYEK